MDYKMFFKKAFSDIRKEHSCPDDETVVNNILERAKTMNNNNENERTYNTQAYEVQPTPTKGHKALSVVAGIAGTAAVLTGAVFGLNWLNEHGGLKEGGIGSSNGAGYHEDMTEPAQSEAATMEAMTVSKAKTEVPATFELTTSAVTVIINSYEFDGKTLNLNWDVLFDNELEKYNDPEKNWYLLVNGMKNMDAFPFMGEPDENIKHIFTVTNSFSVSERIKNCSMTVELENPADSIDLIIPPTVHDDFDVPEYTFTATVNADNVQPAVNENTGKMIYHNGVAALEYDDCTIVITDYKFDGLRLDLTYDYYPKYLKSGYHILLGSTATNIGSAFGTIDMEAFEKHEPYPSYGNKTSYMLFSPADEIDVGFITESDNQIVGPPEIVRRIDDTEVNGINSDLRRETVKDIVHCTLPVNTENGTDVVDVSAWVEQPNGKSLELDRMYIANSVIMCVYRNVGEDIFNDWDDDIADMEVFLINETDDIKMSETPNHVYDEYAEEKWARHCKFGDTIYTFYYSDREFGWDDVRAVYLGGKCVISKDGDTNTFYQPSCFQSFYIPPEEDRMPLTDAHAETEKCDIKANWLAFDGMTLVLQYDVTFKNGLPADGSVVPIWAFGDNTEKPYTTHGSRVDKLDVNGDTVSYIGEIVYNRVIFDEPIKIYFMDDHTWASEVFIPFDEKNTGIIVFMPEELPNIGTSTYNVGKEVTLLSDKKINVESVTLGDYSVMITFDCETVAGFDTNDTYLVMNDGSRINLDSLENKGGTFVENSQNIYHFILSEKLNIAQVKEIYVCGECVYGDTEPVPTMQQDELPEETTEGDTEAETTE
ncbi:MAG: hypothetical protein IJ784_02975 [Ruminiclostridium sp.]|nr:hypothetical protein [Ruminiclostridium sp.]